MCTSPAPDAEAARLAELESERSLHLRLLAVVIEQLLRATEADQVEISRLALSEARPLQAWNDTGGDYVLTVIP